MCICVCVCCEYMPILIGSGVWSCSSLGFVRLLSFPSNILKPQKNVAVPYANLKQIAAIVISVFGVRLWRVGEVTFL